MLRINQRVVCVDNELVERYLTKGAIYTISAIAPDVNAVHLAEVTDKRGYFWGPRFRPLVERKTDVSFVMGANPDSESWDNRIRKTEKV